MNARHGPTRRRLYLPLYEHGTTPTKINTARCSLQSANFRQDTHQRTFTLCWVRCNQQTPAKKTTQPHRHTHTHTHTPRKRPRLPNTHTHTHTHTHCVNIYIYIFFLSRDNANAGHVPPPNRNLILEALGRPKPIILTPLGGDCWQFHKTPPQNEREPEIPSWGPSP